LALYSRPISRWAANLRGGAPGALSLRARRHTGTAEVIADDTGMAEAYHVLLAGEPPSRRGSGAPLSAPTRARRQATRKRPRRRRAQHCLERLPMQAFVDVVQRGDRWQPPAEQAPASRTVGAAAGPTARARTGCAPRPASRPWPASTAPGAGSAARGASTRRARVRRRRAIRARALRSPCPPRLPAAVNLLPDAGVRYGEGVTNAVGLWYDASIQWGFIAPHVSSVGSLMGNPLQRGLPLEPACTRGW
jgi:hypothetical protein